MYVPLHYSENDPQFIKGFVRQHSFGLLVTWDGKRPLATQLLFSLKESGSDTVLLGHVARSNPQWKSFDQTPEALAVFEGPHAYVSAAWYSIRSVPTWNYVTVQMYGRPEIIEDEEQLYSLLKDLVDVQESSKPEQGRYRLESLPKNLVEDKIRGLVGFSLTVSKMECAAKLSQNLIAKDYDNVITKLKGRGDPNSIRIAELMESRRETLKGK